MIDLLFADDLNAYKVYDRNVESSEIMSILYLCQAACHKWGRQNQVEFEPKKESFTIMNKDGGNGVDFKLYGVTFDAGLRMEKMVEILRGRMLGKLFALFKIRKF